MALLLSDGHMKSTVGCRDTTFASGSYLVRFPSHVPFMSLHDIKMNANVRNSFHTDQIGHSEAAEGFTNQIARAQGTARIL